LFKEQETDFRDSNEDAHSWILLVAQTQRNTAARSSNPEHNGWLVLPLPDHRSKTSKQKQFAAAASH
jgi:hypothetical protein